MTTTRHTTQGDHAVLDALISAAAKGGARHAILAHRRKGKYASRLAQAEDLGVPLSTLRTAETSDAWPRGLAGDALRHRIGA